MMMPSIFEENLIDDFMNDFLFFDDHDRRKVNKKLYGHQADKLMRTDVRETDSCYELEMDLPGFKKEEVKASLKDGYLLISAIKGEDEHEKKSGRYIRRERYIGSCERCFYVGDGITENDIKGEFKHGILKLTIPKKDAKPVVEEKKYISIEG